MSEPMRGSSILPLSHLLHLLCSGSPRSRSPRSCSPRSCSPRSGLLVALGSILGIFFFWGAWGLIGAPFGRDQGIFSWQAQEILRGGMPYLDAWDHKGPLSSLLYGVLGWGFGFSPAVLHLFDLLLFGGMLVAVILYWGRDRLVGVASAFFLFCFIAPDWWRSGQPDFWAAEFLVLSAILLSYPRIWTVAFAGILMAGMVLAKPVYFLCFAAVPLIIFQSSFRQAQGGEAVRQTLRQTWCQTLRQTFWFSCLFMFFASVVLFLVILWLFWGGALPAFWDALVIFNLEAHLQSATQFDIIPPLRGVFYPTGSFLSFPAFAVFLIALFALWAGVKERRWGLVLLWLMSWLALAAQRKFYLYHYMPHVSVMCLLSGYAVRALWEQHGRRGRGLALAMLFAVSPFAMAQLSTPEVYDAEPEGFSAEATAEVAAAIQDRTAPDDKVLMWGMDAAVLAMAERSSAVRYGFNYPLRAPNNDGRREEVMAVLSRTPAQMIVVQRHDENSLLEEDSEKALASFEALNSFISLHYRRVWANAHFTLYARRDLSPIFPATPPRTEP